MQTYGNSAVRMTDKSAAIRSAAFAINWRAPVIAAGEIEVKAAPEVIWDIMTDVETWPDWNPDVTSVSISGRMSAGKTFTWKSGPGEITSTVQELQKPWFLGWTGKMLGIKAAHIWQIIPSDGKTLVRTEESWDGWVVRVLRGLMQKNAGKEHGEWIAKLEDRSGTDQPVEFLRKDDE